MLFPNRRVEQPPRGGEHLRPEGGGLVVARIEGKPHHSPVLSSARREPLRNERRLPEPSGRRDERQLRSRPVSSCAASLGRATRSGRGLGRCIWSQPAGFAIGHLSGRRPHK